MKTIKITNENDYAQIFSKRCGCHCAAKSKNALTHLCEDLIPAVSERFTSLDELVSAWGTSYAPNVHIEVSKKNAKVISGLVETYEIVIDDLTYLDSEEYEQHEEIEDCPTNTVDINFVICDLAKLDEIISVVAGKLDVLGEDANVSLNFIFPEGQGTFLNNEGTIIDNSRDPSLIWKIRNGNVIKPDSRMVIFGDDIDNILYYGCHLFRDISVADWKNLFGVEIEVGFKDENN